MKAVVVAAILCASRVALADGGSITGAVIFDGAAPARATIERDTDPVCAKTTGLAEDVIVSDGKLRDVLVRVVKGAKGPFAAPTAPVLITQHDCRYEPHVSAVLVGQPIAIRNGDATYHNVHVSKAGKNLWNLSQPAGDPDLVKDTPGAAGDVISLHCDVHAWMQAWSVVVDNPYFAVSGDDGAFTITGLPPGTYTLEAWHPTLGTRTAKVTIGRGRRAAAKATFHFKAAAAAVH
jgi:hypothetical protein